MPGNELVFFEDEQVYRVGGEVYDRVTDVLKSADLYNFAAVPPDVLERARVRGRAAHLACQYIDEGTLKRSSLDPQIVDRVTAYEKFKSDMGSSLIISNIETPFCSHDLKIAGRPDRIFLIDGWPWIVDLKFTATKNRTTAIQTAAYKLLAGPHFDKDLRRAELHLSRSGTYSLTEFSDENDEALFMSCLAIHRWKKAA